MGHRGVRFQVIKSKKEVLVSIPTLPIFSLALVAMVAFKKRDGRISLPKIDWSDFKTIGNGFITLLPMWGAYAGHLVAPGSFGVGMIGLGVGVLGLFAIRGWQMVHRGWKEVRLQILRDVVFWSGLVTADLLAGFVLGIYQFPHLVLVGIFGFIFALMLGVFGFGHRHWVAVSLVPDQCVVQSGQCRSVVNCREAIVHKRAISRPNQSSVARPQLGGCRIVYQGAKEKPAPKGSYRLAQTTIPSTTAMSVVAMRSVRRENLKLFQGVNLG